MADRLLDWSRQLHDGVGRMFGLPTVIRLSRLFDAAFPVVSLLVGAAVAGAFYDGRLWLLVVVVIMLNSAAMLWNDLEDREIDADNDRHEVKQLSAGNRRLLKLYAVGFMAAGVALAMMVGLTALLLCALSIGAIWLYNSGPVQASRRPILSVVTLSGAGAFLPFLLGVSLGGVSLLSIVAGVAWWGGRMSLSVLKDYKDVRGDARHGKKTFLLVFGRRRVAIVSIVSLIAGYGTVLALVWPGASVMMAAALLIGVVTLAFLRRPLFSGRASYRQLDDKFRMLAQGQLWLDMGILLWLI